MATRESRRAVLYDPPMIRYQIDGAVAGESPLGALRRVIHVATGSDLEGTDVEFDLNDFGESIWVVPDDISLETHRAWSDHLRDRAGYFEASIAWPPKQWLDGGILGMLRRPAARVLHGEKLPPDDRTWKMTEPLDPVIGQPLIQG